MKTPFVFEQMNILGIKNTVVTPVGLDLTLLRRDYDQTSASEIRKKYGYSETDKVLLFIGRLVKEKQPVRMIERIPNSDIWELYRFADVFVNLNQQEIFGMAILEAMY